MQSTWGNSLLVGGGPSSIETGGREVVEGEGQFVDLRSLEETGTSI